MLARMRALAIVVAVAAMGSNDAARFAGAYIPGGAIQTARLSSDAIAAVAERTPAFDPSWASSLLVASGGGAPVELCDRVFHASRPLPLPSGEIVVERGVAGAVVPGRVRVDELTLDAITVDGPHARAVRRIYATTGFEAHLAALAGDEIIVYLVQPGVASLRAIDWRTGRERVVVPSLAPYAHDFSADGAALLVHNRDAEHPERETVDRVDLGNGNVARVRTW
jgi:hypothetical protein